MTASPRAAELALAAAQAASDKLARDIVVIDVSDRLAITDVFVIASADNERQVKAAVEEVEDKLRELGAKPLRREGERDGTWVLLDYADIVVHVQRAEERVFYSLERLWKDCPVIPFTDRDAERVAERAVERGVDGAAERGSERAAAGSVVQAAPPEVTGSDEG